MHIIKLARISFLRYDGKLWIRRDTRDGFNVAIGSSDSAQASDIVGFFLLDQIHERFSNFHGVSYRDDALFLLHNPTHRQMELYKKSIRISFRERGLGIRINPEHSVVNYLDVILDLISRSYRPYHKTNESLRYVRACSNHPPSIKRGIIDNVSARISSISIKENIFKECEDYYNRALNSTGYKGTIVY